jgi:hypothetical protein
MAHSNSIVYRSIRCAISIDAVTRQKEPGFKNERAFSSRTGFALVGALTGFSAAAQTAPSICTASLIYEATSVSEEIQSVPTLSNFALVLLCIALASCVFWGVRRLPNAQSRAMAVFPFLFALALSGIATHDVFGQSNLVNLLLNNPSGGTLNITGTGANSIRNATKVPLRISSLVTGSNTTLGVSGADCSEGGILQAGQSCTVQLGGACSVPAAPFVTIDATTNIVASTGNTFYL